jgi:predicted RNA methylase
VRLFSTPVMVSVWRRANRMIRYAAAGRFDYFAYALWVRFHRLDFSPVPLHELGFSEEHGERHAASGGVFLGAVVDRLKVPSGSRIIDMGCGKGSAVCTLARYPFAEIAGVDLSEQLIETARANAAKLRLSNTVFYVSDASTFTDWDRFTHIYMFNPFPAQVMRKMMRNVVASVKSFPRTTTIIYLNPLCHSDILDTGVFTLRERVMFKNTLPFHIYTYEPSIQNEQKTASPAREC